MVDRVLTPERFSTYVVGGKYPFATFQPRAIAPLQITRRRGSSRRRLGEVPRIKAELITYVVASAHGTTSR